MKPHPLQRPLRLILFTALSLSLAACASMSEEECLTANWQDRGYRDGRDGYGSGRVEDHREACAKVGVVPDLAQYRAGHRVGIREYCTPENGMREGRQGHYYRSSCPAELEADFLYQYRQGQRVYNAQQRLDNLQKDLERAERELDRERDEKKRKDLRQNLRDLDDRVRRARHELMDEERRLLMQSRMR